MPLTFKSLAAYSKLASPFQQPCATSSLLQQHTLAPESLADSSVCAAETVTLAVLGLVIALLSNLTRCLDALQDAIDGGFFTTPESSPSQPQLSRIVETAMQIASAISYLHAQNIIQGSINGASIMLSSVLGADDAVAQVSKAVLKERFGSNLDALPAGS